jgi:hypothetical protein
MKQSLSINYNYFGKVSLFVLALAGIGLSLISLSIGNRNFKSSNTVFATTGEYALPEQSEWTDHGLIISKGTEGEWDSILWGAFGSALVKKDGVYYLYYQGASGYDTVGDSVMWRTIGVATSSDGLSFTKYAQNPVLTYFPTNNSEEGATSTAPVFGDNGEIVMYFGANTATSTSLVNADGRFATSTDGFNFTDQGIVLNHALKSVWGYGDEIYPIIAIHDAGKWIVYYLPNGTAQSHKLGVASGTSVNGLTSTSAATANGFTIDAWGMGSSAEISEDKYALFINNGNTGNIQVRTVSISTPNQLSTVFKSYNFPNLNQGFVYLDKDLNKWFLYYRTEAGYGVMTAPAILIVPTATPTSTPTPTPTPSPTPTPTASPTPTPTPTPTPINIVMSVADLDAQVLANNGTNWSPSVTIKVVNANNETMSGALVRGTWTGITTKRTTCTTDTQGLCRIDPGSTLSQQVTFTVSNLTKTGYTYNSSANTDPDGDSNGTIIVINKP